MASLRTSVKPMAAEVSETFDDRVATQAIAAHVAGVVARSVAEPVPVPFPHLVLDEVLPSAVFEELLGTLPLLPAFDRPERELAYASSKGEREVFALSAHVTSQRSVPPVFRCVDAALRSDQVIQSCAVRLASREHNDGVGTRLSAQVLLSRDHAPYAIGPHTDVPKRLASMILYLGPATAPEQWGTALFVPQQAGFVCTQGRHYDFDGFEPARTIPFAPNRALLFARTNRSFHGLLPMVPGNGPRTALLYEIVKDAS